MPRLAQHPYNLLGSPLGMSLTDRASRPDIDPVWEARYLEFLRAEFRRRNGSFTLTREARRGIMRAGVKDPGLREELGADYFDRSQSYDREAR